MSALPAGDRDLAGSGPAAEWAQIAPAAPLLAATMRRYLGQLGCRRGDLGPFGRRPRAGRFPVTGGQGAHRSTTC